MESPAETVLRIKNSSPTTCPLLSYPVSFRPPGSVPAFTIPRLAQVILAEALAAARGGRTRRRHAMGGLPDVGDGEGGGEGVGGREGIATLLREAATRAGVDEDGLRAAAAALAQAPIVGRLAAVGRLSWFGKAGRKGELPLYFKFRIVDASRCVDVMCWNGAALRWHRALSAVPPGTLLAVINYKVKVWNGAAEVSINASGPEGLVVHLREQSAALFGVGALPQPVVHVTSEARCVFEAPEGRSLSFVGIVQRLGPLCRTLTYDADLLDGRATSRRGGGRGWGRRRG